MRSVRPRLVVLLAAMVVALGACSGAPVADTRATAAAPIPDCTASDLTLRLVSQKFTPSTWWWDTTVGVVSSQRCLLPGPATLELDEGTRGWVPVPTAPYDGPSATPDALPRGVVEPGTDLVVELGYVEAHEPLRTCVSSEMRVLVAGAALGFRAGCWQGGVRISGPGTGSAAPG